MKAHSDRQPNHTENGGRDGFNANEDSRSRGGYGGQDMDGGSNPADSACCGL
jgi:hypothetical protein